MTKFDPLGDLQGLLGPMSKGAKLGWKLGAAWRASRVRKAIEAEYGAEVADAVAAAIRAGRDPRPIIEAAKRARTEAANREKLLANPPPLHGSARWAGAADLTRFLKGRAGFDHPRSILLGTFRNEDGLSAPAYFHWDDDGHLLSLAATRSGKAVTTIIPNLLRYRGSAVVLDPKGELYAATSRWRAENVGPVYRIAPFDDGSNPATAGFPRHGFNPLARVRNQSDARALAEQLFPRDPKAAQFFTDEAVSFVTALIRFVIDTAPPERRNLVTVRKLAALPLPKFKALVGEMANSRIPAVREAADNVLGKSEDRGLPNLRDTLHSKLAMWSDEQIQESLRAGDVVFEDLKNRPATVYVDVPFDLMTPYAPWLRVVLKSALDAMLRNTTVPEIPVLFVLDEFLALGPFAEFRDAIRTHAGAGVRLWFFLQDLGSLEEIYPGTGWRPFLNCSVKQFFGVDDPYTGELIGRYLGNATLAFRSTSAGTNVSAQQDNWLGDGGSAGTTLTTGESVQFVGKPLLTPDEVMELLGAWQPEGWRWGIVHTRGPRPAKLRLVPWTLSETCKARVGAYLPSPAPQGSPE